MAYRQCARCRGWYTGMHFSKPTKGEWVCRTCVTDAQRVRGRRRRGEDGDGQRSRRVEERRQAALAPPLEPVLESEPLEAQEDPQVRSGLLRPVHPLKVQAMERAQQGLCAIHNGPETMLDARGQPRRLVVYCNTVTGRVVGLVCSRCNIGLAAFGDDVTLLIRAVAFLSTPLSESVELRAALREAVDES